MNSQLAAIITAYILDLIFGDPQWQWHPVRLIGRLIEKLEIRLNNGKFNRRFCGVILVILVVGITVLCVWAILRLSGFMHPVFYYLISVLLIYFAISTKSLAVEAGKVKEALLNKDIALAKARLSMIVGRDTGNLDEKEIIKGSVETVAESIMDGIISPLFYVFLGGAVLVWAYKAVNTLDSMVGYRNQRFLEFGWFSAKLDGLMNFIPAKITCFLIAVSGLCFSKRTFASLKWTMKYFLKGAENNSAATEAAMAGLLGIQLGGVSFYNSAAVQKPIIGDSADPLNIKHIRESIKIAYIASGLFIVIVMGLIFLSGRR